MRSPTLVRHPSAAAFVLMALAWLGGFALGEAAPPPLPHRYPPADSTLIADLKDGGYVLVFRHEKTDMSQRDTDVLNFADRSSQRNLNAAGREEARRVGKDIAALDVPVGEVLSSPMWRCRDTATIEFGRADTTIDLLRKSRESRTVRLRLLSTVPDDGTNTVLVTHQDVLLPILNLRRDELAEGDALLVKPLGNGSFRVLAQVTPDDWNRFARSHKL